jgi:hypothetical protein
LVGPTVIDMSYERLAYDDADTALQMHDDCTACGPQLTLPRQRVDEPSSVIEPRSLIEVSEATAALGARLHLHLD